MIVKTWTLAGPQYLISPPRCMTEPQQVSDVTCCPRMRCQAHVVWLPRDRLMEVKVRICVNEGRSWNWRRGMRRVWRGWLIANPGEPLTAPPSPSSHLHHFLTSGSGELLPWEPGSTWSRAHRLTLRITARASPSFNFDLDFKWTFAQTLGGFSWPVDLEMFSWGRGSILCVWWLERTISLLRLPVVDPRKLISKNWGSWHKLWTVHIILTISR